MKETIQSWKKEPRDKKVQYCCVLVLLILELMFFSPPVLTTGVAALGVDYFIVIPAGIFLLITLRKGINRKGRATLVLGLVMAAWAVVVEVLRIFFGMEFFAPGGIAMYYGIALPMAFVLEDEQRQWGITAFALLFVLTGIRLCIQTAGLILGILPESYSIFVRWDGTRLLQMFHPSNCALILMLGIGFTLALCFRTKQNWVRFLLIVLAIVQFGVQSMTNGRNAVGFTSLMMGGFLFCAVRGTGWKRIPVALVAGAALAGILFMTSQRMFAIHEQRMYDASLQQTQTNQAEQADVVEQKQQIEAFHEMEASDGSDQPEEFREQAGKQHAQIDNYVGADGKWIPDYGKPGEWVTDSVGTWYQNPDGSYPVNCWENIDGADYYFDASGYRVENQWVGGYYVGEDGKWIPDYGKTGEWVTDSVGTWYKYSDGSYPMNCWKNIDGVDYYFNAFGYCVKNQWGDNYQVVMFGENKQGSLREDLVTFNGRTDIWAEALNGVLRHPTILLCGTDSMMEVLREEYKVFAEHTHSSYLDTLYTLGIPGLLLSVAITLLVLRAGVLVLWRNTDLWKSCVAVITLCTLGSSILEPYLFAAKNYHHYICVIFLVAAGYLHQWSLDK